jgi:hypothetical protein
MDCTRPPTDADTFDSSFYNVVGVLKLRESYLGVTKEKISFFSADTFNHDLPTLDLTY